MDLEFFGPLKTALSIIGSFWWLYAPVLFFIGSVTGWISYATQRYLLSLNWILLEVKPPPDVPRSPKSAENIFAGLHGTYLPVTRKKRFIKGEVPTFFSFEIVSNGGETNFYVRTPESLRPLVESQIFAQYPDAEIKPVDDYVKKLPPSLPNNDYDLFGADLVFSKSDVYPVRTYPYFEEMGVTGLGEPRRTDPLSPLAEIMSALEPGEHIWLQFIIRPTGADWTKGIKMEIDKLIGKEVKIKPNLPGRAVDLIESALGSLGQALGETSKKEEKKEEKEKVFEAGKITPGQRIVLEQMENKVSKLAFKGTIRFIYLARKEKFHRSHISAVIGTFKQLYANNLNSFRPNRSTMTFHKGYLSQIFPSDRGFFASQIEFRLKTRLYQNYRRRNFLKKVIILNTEELATLFHLPGISVKAPAFPRVEARKGQPPAGLPM